MTNEEAIEILEERWRYSKTYKYTDAEIREAFDMAIKALEQEPCEDAISRQAAIEAVYDNEYKKDVRKALENLPSVAPQPKTGQWQELKETIIEMRDNDGIGTQQEVCKFLTNLMDVLEKQMADGKKERKKNAT